MQTKQEEMIHYDSPEAAKWVTDVSGWVNSQGVFYGNNEGTARWSGCTHRDCEDCGTVIDKRYTVCDTCKETRDEVRYYKLPVAESFEFPLYSDSHDRYFWDDQELYEYLWDELEVEVTESTIDSLRLKTCEPEHLSTLDADHWSDELPEDEYELPSEVSELVDKLNEIILKQPPTMYYPGKTRVDTDQVLGLWENSNDV